MKKKKVSLIINPRAGAGIGKLAEIGAVFAAAGWKTDITLKEFGGHALQLAHQSARAGRDLVIGCGGDGTINQIVNGVMSAKRRRSVIGVIPGGTANVWAHEIGLPADPVAAALALVDSDARWVDLGYFEVEALEVGGEGKRERRPVPPAKDGVHHFLLMAGLGADAEIMQETPAPLKEKVGMAAAAAATVKELTGHKPFPVELVSRTKGGETSLWKGDALQVVIGNTRRYGNIGAMTPDAFIDDGVLDVLVIPADGPLATVQQITSFLLHGKPSDGRSQQFQGAHLAVTVPAGVAMQVDGSPVQLADSLRSSDESIVHDQADADVVMVTYRFDAIPRAVRIAIPKAYNDALFQDGDHSGNGNGKTDETAEPASVAPLPALPQTAPQPSAVIDEVLANGREVSVAGVASSPRRDGDYIVAGERSKNGSADVKPVAVRVGRKTEVWSRDGTMLPAAAAGALRPGARMVVEGKESKRGVLRAKRILLD